MRNFYVLIFTLLFGFCLTQVAFSQLIFKKPLSKRVTEYKIKAFLNTDTKTILGSQNILWTNTSTDSVLTIQMHLYMNAFKNENSTFLKNTNTNHFSEKNSWGWINLKSIRIKNSADLTKRIKFIAPDDGNTLDETVIEIALDKPIYPGQTLELETDFECRLPEIYARSGYTGDYFLVGQWFPKMGVYEPAGTRYAVKGGWNCHQYHRTTEFYANFGTYHVELTVPSEYKTGATGVLLKKQENKDKTTTLEYRAEDVVDFAWTASPKFIEKEQIWKDVTVKLLYTPEHKNFSEQQFEAAFAALDKFEQLLGKYPYPQITIVCPPLYGMASSGMEYPMFITTQCVSFFPDGFKIPELTTIHELGHNYFMGILASNETEEAWLDEGLNSYLEQRIMDDVYKYNNPFISFLGIKVSDLEYHRSGYVSYSNPRIAESARLAWEFADGGYGVMSYNKPVLWLKTLENMVGTETMDVIMKTYYDRWSFKHPCGRDFVNIVNEVIVKRHGKEFGANLNWFFQQVLYGTGVCDYKLAGIRTNSNNNGKAATSSVAVHRIGEVEMPVEILVHFENGEEILEKWEGKARSKTFYYTNKPAVLWAKIDPDNKVLIDINTLNNSYTTQPATKPFWKYMVDVLFWIQNIIQTAGFLA